MMRPTRLANGNLRVLQPPEQDEDGIPVLVDGFIDVAPGTPLFEFWDAYLREVEAEMALTSAGGAEDDMAEDNPQIGADTGLPTGWRGPIAALDVATGDGRMLSTPPGGLRVRPHMSLQWAQELSDGHDGAVVVGRIDRAWIDGNLLHGEGPFDLGSEDGREAARRVREGMLPGISVDPDEVTVEYRWYAPDGNEMTQDEIDAMWEQTLEDIEDGGMIPIGPPEGVTELMVMTDWRLSAATLVSIPAFAQTRVEPIDDYVPADVVEDAEDDMPADDEAMVAAAGRGQVFRREFFEDPALEAPTPLTVTPEGRVFGHVALFGTCHLDFPGTCVTPPKSLSNYARFHVHGARLDDGSVLPVGIITYGAGHASQGSMRASRDHYADVATAAVKVRAGEDRHGIWLAGQVLDSHAAIADDILLSPLSGHWEPDPDAAGALELIGAHVVVVPGFKVPRLVASQGGALIAASPRAPRRVPALTAGAGITVSGDGTRATTAVGIEPSALTEAMVAALDEHQRRRAQRIRRVAELAARVNA